MQKFPDATRREIFIERMIDLGLASDAMIEDLAASGLVERMIDLGKASPDVLLTLKARGLASEKVLEEIERDRAIDATIPVVNLQEYLNPETKEAFLKQIYDACHEVGFFAVRNTGVDLETLDAGYAAIADFFSQPYEKKMTLFNRAVNGQRGYIPGESAKGEAAGDFKEFLHVGREIPEEEAAELKTWNNIWPEEGNLKRDLYALYEALEGHKVLIENALAEAIGMPNDFFSSMTEKGDNLLRAIHYPQNPPKTQMWAAEHTDIDLLTILPRATARGLQVKNAKGDWIDVVVPDDAFIINVGDMLENITNGEFRSSLHRVKAESGGYERYSLVHFIHPRSDDRLDPLPCCIERTSGLLI
jgi:isopenicillin N synthase-like dioxygenase